MWNSFHSSPRTAETTLPCARCGRSLTAVRGCRDVQLRCPACQAVFPVEHYVAVMDEALERFLENVYCNRI